MTTPRSIERSDWTTIDLEVRPGHRSTGIEWDPWRGAYRVHVVTEPSRGKANEEVLRLLSVRLGLPASSVEWAVAGKSRSKRVRIRGLTAEQVHDRLLGAPRSASSSPDQGR